jgi:hypothetical protein
MDFLSGFLPEFLPESLAGILSQQFLLQQESLAETGCICDGPFMLRLRGPAAVARWFSNKTRIACNAALPGRIMSKRRVGR